MRIQKQPAVSVLVPAYNTAGTLGCTMESMLKQTFDDFEIVAVDDGSTDDTLEALQAYEKRDSRVHAVSGPHQGIIGTLNLGLSHCRGEFIARMDADDVSHPRRLELQVNFLRSHPDINVCSSRVRCFPLNRVQGGLKRYEGWLNSLMNPDEIARDMFVESPVAHPSVMLRRNELLKIGGYQEHGWPEDYDLWLRYHTAGKLFAKLPQTLLFWRAGQERLTFTDSRYSVENFLRAKAHYLAKILKDKHPEIILWGAGMFGRRLCKHLVREEISIKAVVDVDVKKIGHQMRRIPILPLDYLKNDRSTFVVTAVGSLDARPLIRKELESLGRIELKDFICAA